MEKINFFVPLNICKATSESGGLMEMEGVASTVDKDTDGEELNPSGYNLQPFLNNGIVNWNHRSKDNPELVIGEPIEAKITKDNKLYVKVRLFPNSEKAKEVYKLAQVMEKNSSSRRLGFSIEGFPVKRDPINEKKILAADITGLAITPTPKNRNTFASICKGEYSEPFLDDDADEGEIEKFISAESIAATTNESLEGVKIKKSKIYSLISKSLGTNNPEILTKVYNFINNNKMANTAEEIEKALSDLENQLKICKDATLEKAKVSSKEHDEENGDASEMKQDNHESENYQKLEDEKVVSDGDEDNEKISKAGKECWKEGMSKSQLTEELIRKGYNLETSSKTAESVIKEMESKKQGGDITEMSLGEIKKSQEEFFSKIEKSFEEKLSKTIDVFKKISVGLVSKNEELEEQLQIVKSENEKLSKSLDAPLQRKSVNVPVKERFEEKIEKSQDSTVSQFDVSTKDGRRDLCDAILLKAEECKISGKPIDESILRAISSIEMTGQVANKATWEKIEKFLK